MNDYHRVTTLEKVNAYGKCVVAAKRAWWLLEKAFCLQSFQVLGLLSHTLSLSLLDRGSQCHCQHNNKTAPDSLA